VQAPGSYDNSSMWIRVARDSLYHYATVDIPARPRQRRHDGTPPPDRLPADGAATAKPGEASARLAHGPAAEKQPFEAFGGQGARLSDGSSLIDSASHIGHFVRDRTAGHTSVPR